MTTEKRREWGVNEIRGGSYILDGLLSGSSLRTSTAKTNSCLFMKKELEKESGEAGTLRFHLACRGGKLEQCFSKYKEY